MESQIKVISHSGPCCCDVVVTLCVHKHSWLAGRQAGKGDRQAGRQAGKGDRQAGRQGREAGRLGREVGRHKTDIQTDI